YFSKFFIFFLNYSSPEYFKLKLENYIFFLHHFYRLTQMFVLVSKSIKNKKAIKIISNGFYKTVFFKIFYFLFKLFFTRIF
ncbi:hypothetical protein BOQ60_24700, partial [Chryseobacterium sp. CH1]